MRENPKAIRNPQAVAARRARSRCGARQSFCEVVLAVREANARAVAQKAAVANRIAHACARHEDRRRAYGVKTQLLNHALAKFPEEYRLSAVENGGRLVGIRFRSAQGFHVPVTQLAAPSLAWLEAQCRRARATAVDADQ